VNTAIPGPISPSSRHDPPSSVPIHRQEVDDVGPPLPVLVPVAHRLGCDRVAVGSRTLEHFAQTAKVTEHAPRGRDTSRNSLVPLGASESPRSALSPAISVPRDHAPTTGRGKRDLRHGKWSQATSNDRLGFLAVPRLWGLPDTPQAQAVRFPTHTHRYSESPYGSSPARFPASICSAAWDRSRT
jgi:hypothetical protein